MKRHAVAKAILYSLAGTGLVVTALIAPNLIGVLAKSEFNRRFSSKQLSNSLFKLKQNRLISITEKDGKTIVRLTKQGQEKVLRYKLADVVIKKPRQWDKFWRFVVFDVPEKLKVNRDYFVAKLKEIGFYQVQRSVWVYPYPCEDEVDFLKEVYGVSKYVRIITARSLDSSLDLFRKFNLSP